MNRLIAWWPAIILGSGVLVVHAAGVQQRMALRLPLSEALPARIDGLEGLDVQLPPAEVDLTGMTAYVMRQYGEGIPRNNPAFTLYIGYYATQAEGKAIHSPKNCLPGAGWEPLVSSRAVLATAHGEIPVNRYIVQNGDRRALVLYWYQGRGRFSASEYRVKWNLLKDAALRGRTEEALVRVMVPITDTEASSFELATRVAAAVIPAVTRALPEA